MSLLTEQDRNQLENDLEQVIGKHAFDAIEAAILAKLASAELPEHQELSSPMDERAVYGYTADQLHQAHAQGFAQGAASVLSAEPEAYGL